MEQSNGGSLDTATLYSAPMYIFLYMLKGLGEGSSENLKQKKASVIAVLGHLRF